MKLFLSFAFLFIHSFIQSNLFGNRQFFMGCFLGGPAKSAAILGALLTKKTVRTTAA